MLDSGRVRAARLESGTGRMYFDTNFPSDAAAADAAVLASSTASNAVASTSQPGTATSQGAKTKFQKQFVVKMADKSDNVLLGKVLQSGVEFAVFR